MKPKLFGYKTKALFDIWSLGHLVVHFGLTKILMMRLQFWANLMTVFTFGLGWEFLERHFEKHHQWFKKYFHHDECWHNRYIGDMISNLAGFFLAYYL